MEPTVQRLKVVDNDPLKKAMKYYGVLSAVNDIKLTEREIQLVSFIAIKGNMGYSSNRDEFIEKYKSSSATINNIISRLKKTGLLIKENNRTRVNPKVLPDFNGDIIIQIKMLTDGKNL